MSSRRAYLGTLAIMAAVTAPCLLWRSRLATVDVAMVLLLGVVVVSARYARGPALLASLISIAAFDFLFVPPYYTFDVHDGAYLLTFAVMLAVALTMTRLTGQILEHAAEAEERARRAAAVAALNTELMEAERPGDVLAALERHVAAVVGGEACTLTPKQLDGDPADWAPATRELLASAPERVVARRVHEDGRTAGLGTARCADADVLVVPLGRSGRHLGVVAVRPESDRAPTPAEIATIEALADQAALAHERTVLAEQGSQARAEAEAERLRSSLLSSLSHDFRTPLATIEGAASGLLEEDGALPPDGRRELAAGILEESRRMTRLVANLLNMVRVETGALAVQKSWQPLEEVVGVVLLRLEEQLARHPVEVDLPPNLPLVPVDELLVEQVFINLLENAARYTPPGTAVAVTAWETDGAVCVQVADGGPGVPPEAEELVFRKFYRGARPKSDDGSEAAGGSGLGLTIAQGIVSAHGGRMWVEPRPGGGAAFRFTLPLSGPAVPAPPAEPEPRPS
jgi:two-component system, OmpR family, sensor histidine kinase KdpD